MSEAITPMIRQYQRLRTSVPADTLLLLRLGEDATALLNLARAKQNRRAHVRHPVSRRRSTT